MKLIIKKYFNNYNLKLFSFYFLISLIFTSFFNGLETLNFNYTQWLFSGDDRSAHQLGWHFFKNDVWRFPLGSNPNFGNEIGNSIIYSDSIPILALLFKSINFLLPENFQYISTWYVICFFLQGVLSYFLILKITDNKKISIFFSFFFLLFPPALYRIGWHPALFGHWTLILTIILIFKNNRTTDTQWTLLILLTSLIHFYFTVINLIIFNTIKFYSLVRKKISFKKYLSIILISHASLILLMFSAGYFEVRLIDTFALGFGKFKLNLLSIFDSTITHQNLSWSWIIPDIKLANGEELEGFNFLGLGGIILIILGIYSLLSEKKIKILDNKVFDNGIYFAILILFLLSLSNNIAFGKTEVLSIPLADYFYGPLSIIRSSGRLFWIVSYFLIFLSIYFISQRFKKNSSFILLIILIIQLFDISSALRMYRINDISKNLNLTINDKFWKKKEIIELNSMITTRPVNYNKHFDKLAYYMERNNIYKTNIIKMARVDRNKAAINRYKLTENFINKNLEENTIYIVDNIGHLLSLKEIFKNSEVGFFFKDNLWLMIKNKKKLMNPKDKEILNRLKIYQTNLFNKKKLNYKDNNDFVGLGWSHNSNKDGIWSEGNSSNLLFKLDNDKNIFFQMDIVPFLNEKNREIDITVLVNGKFNNNLNFKFDKNLKEKARRVIFKIKKENLNKKIINIEFQNKNPKSPFDLRLSPDSRQLSFLLLNFKFFSKNI